MKKGASKVFFVIMIFMLSACGGGGGGDSENNSTTSNYPPVASAGIDTVVAIGGSITLSGINSYDPEGKTLSYIWTIKDKPLGSNVIINGQDSIEASISFDIGGIYVVSLIVSDGIYSSISDDIILNALDFGNYGSKNNIIDIENFINKIKNDYKKSLYETELDYQQRISLLFDSTKTYYVSVADINAFGDNFNAELNKLEIVLYGDSYRTDGIQVKIKSRGPDPGLPRYYTYNLVLFVPDGKLVNNQTISFPMTASQAINFGDYKLAFSFNLVPLTNYSSLTVLSELIKSEMIEEIRSSGWRYYYSFEGPVVIVKEAILYDPISGEQKAIFSF